MPHDPRIRINVRELPFEELPNIYEMVERLPPEVKTEILDQTKKGKYVQNRMPIDVWVNLRKKQHEMADHLRGMGYQIKDDEIPMTNILRNIIKQPVWVGNEDLKGMILKKKKKGRLFE